MEQEIKAPELWKIAQKRAGFKYHVLIYFIMNIFFWTIWYLGLKNTPVLTEQIDTIPWPVWPMFGWELAYFLITWQLIKTIIRRLKKNIKN